MGLYGKHCGLMPLKVSHSSAYDYSRWQCPVAYWEVVFVPVSRDIDGIKLNTGFSVVLVWMPNLHWTEKCVGGIFLENSCKLHEHSSMCKMKFSVLKTQKSDTLVIYALNSFFLLVLRLPTSIFFYLSNLTNIVTHYWCVNRNHFCTDCLCCWNQGPNQW